MQSSLFHLRIQKDEAYYSHVGRKSPKNRGVKLSKAPQQVCGRAGVEARTAESGAGALSAVTAPL